MGQAESAYYAFIVVMNNSTDKVFVSLYENPLNGGENILLSSCEIQPGLTGKLDLDDPVNWESENPMSILDNRQIKVVFESDGEEKWFQACHLSAMRAKMDLEIKEDRSLDGINRINKSQDSIEMSDEDASEMYQQMGLNCEDADKLATGELDEDAEEQFMKTFEDEFVIQMRNDGMDDDLIKQFQTAMKNGDKDCFEKVYEGIRNRHSNTGNAGNTSDASDISDRTRE